MSLLNVGARALLTNQVALQTTGHNIANVSTTGYSRQTAHLATVPGQYTTGGYVGKGVMVETILRNHSELLSRQAALASSAQAGDVVRSERLSQMQEVFTGGKDSLGNAISDMLGSLSDVFNSPTDMTARTVTLTRMNETAGRFRTAAERIADIEYTVTEQLKNNAVKINALAQNVADVNRQIVAAQGTGQVPNDLLDKRDQLIRDLNKYIQTTPIAATDGSVSLFVASSQPLVLGDTASEISIEESKDYPGSGKMALYFNRPNTTALEMNPNMLAGGEVVGLLKFANEDMAEGRNLLGRMAQALAMTMNEQHKLGLTLDGKSGQDLFSITTSVDGTTKGTGVGTIDFTSATTDPTKFAASDYEVRFNNAPPPFGQVIRLSDGKATDFTGIADPVLQNIDGLTFNLTTAGAPGETMLFKPFGSAASNIKALVHAPNDLAAANPINAAMGTSNGGSLQMAGLKATGIPALTVPAIGTNAVLTFDGAGGFTVAGGGVPQDISTTPPTPLAGPPYSYVSGKAINIDGWQVTLQGTPKNGDTVSIGNALDSTQYGDAYKRNAGNAGALMALRDKELFDNATLQDGWAGAMAQVGTRTQSAQYAANMSTTIANNLERDRTAVSGVNLDEEAAKLIQYQQAYQASAKMLQVAQSIFDSLIQTVGR